MKLINNGLQCRTPISYSIKFCSIISDVNFVDGQPPHAVLILYVLCKEYIKVSNIYTWIYIDLQHKEKTKVLCTEELIAIDLENGK